MFAKTLLSNRTRRRGVVLVVVLAMLGLLALIGVTFATFASQAQISARGFAQSANLPDAGEMMDWALTQLIEDTADPKSVVRGHSLKRDMYGNDAWYNGSLLNGFPDGSGPMLVTAVTVNTVNGSNYLDLTTNIPYAAITQYGYSSFVGWSLIFSSSITNQAVSSLYLGSSHVSNTYLTGESHEIMSQYLSGSNLVLRINIPYNNTPYTYSTNTNFSRLVNSTPSVTGINTYAVGIDGYTNGVYTQSVLPSSAPYDSSAEPNGFPHGIPLNTPILLDGRFLKGFNGAGLSTLPDANNANLTTSQPVRSVAEYANFRYNGNLLLNALIVPGGGGTGVLAPAAGTPDYPGDYNASGNPMHYAMPGMDEDYDAGDLENWFLAIQAADGSIAVPSFHRPGILAATRVGTSSYSSTSNDWHRQYNVNNTADQNLQALRAMSRILRPRWADGHSAVSFPDLLPSSSGQITYDVDNDGDGTTDSVWLDLGYPTRRNADGKLYKPMFAFMIIGLNGRLPLNTAGNLADRNLTDNSVYDHADHLGNSPSEIDLRFALQNGYTPTMDSSNTVLLNPFVWYNAASSPANQTHPYTQVDNATATVPAPPLTGGTTINVGMPVWATQLRNLLSGTRLPGTATATSAASAQNGDVNTVMINNVPTVFPNNVGDLSDVSTANPTNGGPNLVSVATQPVAGRWGEETYIPTQLPVFFNNLPPSDLEHYHTYVYDDPKHVVQGDPANDVIHRPGPGHSITFPNNSTNFPYGPLDARDDNFTTYDPYPAGNPESGDLYDLTGSIMLPSERSRRFVTPVDLTGDGQVVTFNPPGGANRRRLGGAGSASDMKGADQFGRVQFFHYFRPPGLPTATAAAGESNTGSSIIVKPTTPSSLLGHIPMLAYNPNETPTTQDYYDGRTNNKLHGYIAQLVPTAPTNTINVAGGGTQPIRALALSATPSDMPNTNTVPAPPTQPTFDYSAGVTGDGIGELGTVNPTFPTFSQIVNSNSYFPSPGINEADEMDLYSTTGQLDAPFGPADLEWLYRSQDVDGPSLQSRLNYLAPISFNNPLDGKTRRRRLFAIDSFDTNRYAWANDNPSGAFPANSSFGNLASPSFTVLPGGPNAKPSIANGDRRINLNFPLPVSNSPQEPIRQKWIRETYTLLKNILPPRAVDTPEELAALSQYVVNIIDFRDPDCTATKFVNTDLIVAQSTVSTQPDMLFNLNNLPSSTNYSVTYSTTAPPPTLATTPSLAMPPFDPTYDPSANGTTNGTFNITVTANGTPTTYSATYLTQFGMEYPAVAINEVLSFRFQGNVKNPTTLPAGYVGNTQATTPAGVSGSFPDYLSAFFVELVNVVTKDSFANSPDTSDLDLAGWDLVVMKDDATGQPNPWNGQIPERSTPDITAYALDGSGAVTSVTNTSAYNATSNTSGTRSLQSISTAVATKPGVGAVPTWHGYPTWLQGISGPGVVTPLVFGGYSMTTAAETYPTGTTYFPPTNAPISGLPTVTSTTTPTFVPDANVAGQLAGLTENTFYWLYLRRPPNPFDPTYDSTRPNANRVVVDCFRFIYTTANGTAYTNTTATQGTAKPTNDVLFSIQRMQPFRGGHAVPPLNANAVTTAQVNSAYGYSEQTVRSKTPGTSYTNGQYVASGGSIALTTSTINDSLGTYTRSDAWDYLPFNDRDFTSVVELAMVPSCPPGLFSKQFCEAAPPILGTTPISSVVQAGSTFAITPTSSNTTTVAQVNLNKNSTTTPYQPFLNNSTLPASFSQTSPPHTFPYLNDEFFYTAANENPSGSWWPDFPYNTPSPYPYRSQGTVNATGFGGISQPSGAYIGGPGGAGYYKMLEFFEVPTTSGKSTSPVFLGNNYDWLRQDTRPGQLNLNLIIDEEVFLGLLGAWWYGDINDAVGNSYSSGFLNSTQLPYQLQTLPTNQQTPAIVTMIDDTGSPITSVSLNNVGMLDSYLTPITNGAYTPGSLIGVANSQPNILPTNPAANSNRMKAVFSDFLKLRHGGSGYIYGFGAGGTGMVGLTNGVYTPIAAERPFRSLSFPDINYTIMRPATLPPGLPIPLTGASASNTFMQPNTFNDSNGNPLNYADFLNGRFPAFPATIDPLYYPTPNTFYNVNDPPKMWTIGWTPRDTTATWPYYKTGNTAPQWFYTQDPGVKSPYLYTQTNPIQPPPLPPRRLFQIADLWGFQWSQYAGYGTQTLYPLANSTSSGTPAFPQQNPATPPPNYPAVPIPSPISNASSAYNASNVSLTNNMGTVTAIPVATGDPAVNNQVLSPNLSDQRVDLAAPLIPGTPPQNVYYGNATTATGTNINQNDQRDHPYFRTEMLQKIANLTTPRTQQYAVWITVAFFEVTQEGNPQLANDPVNYIYAYDILGLEVGALDGRNVRYRGFFVIDRTKAVGFNPQMPGDFRTCVTYRNLIE